MKRIKSICALLSLCILFTSVMIMPVHAVNGRVVIEVNTSVSIGEELAVTVRCLDSADNLITGNIRLEFNSEKFEYVSCDTAGATVSDGTVSAVGKSVVITLKAISGSEAIVTAYATDEAGNELTAAGVGITLNGEDTSADVEDGLLSKLAIEGVVISPTFQADIYEYSATVPYDTDSLTIDARTSSEDARIVSITGATVLEVGKNTIEIIVEASNGDRTTYTIHVTRLNEGAGQIGQATGGDALISVDGTDYYISTDYSRNMIQAGFQPVELTINETPTIGLRYQDTSIIVLHLFDANSGDDAGYYVYDETTNTVCPYVGFGNADNSQVDRLEKVQTNYEKLYKKYEAIKQKNRNMLIGIIIAIAVLAIIVINILIFRNLNRRTEYDVDYKSTDGDEPLQRQGEYLDAIANNSRGSEEEYSDEVEVIDLEDL